MSYNESLKMDAVASFDKQKISKFASGILVRIKKGREEQWERDIESYIAEKKRQKTKWYGFLVSVPNREEAEHYLKNDSSFYTTYDWAFMKWQEDEQQLQKIINLCGACDSCTVWLSAEMANLLCEWGFTGE